MTKDRPLSFILIGKLENWAIGELINKEARIIVITN